MKRELYKCRYFYQFQRLAPSSTASQLFDYKGFSLACKRLTAAKGRGDAIRASFPKIFASFIRLQE
jgi:hypothetical protein